MKTNHRMQSGFTLVELLVVIAIIVTLAGVATPVLIGQKKNGDRAEAIQNAKQIGLALFNFENDNGKYPDDSTVDLLDDDAIISSAGDANEYFSQLIAGGYVDQESPFYCVTSFSVKPDNNKATAGEILKAGENGFSYVMRSAGVGLSSAVNSAVPIVVAPSAFEADGTYDRNVFNKKAVVLRIDMSVTDPTINEDKEIVASGNDLFDPGTGTVWDDSGISNPEVVQPAVP